MMEQVRKALSRSKTAFEKIQKHRRISGHLLDEDGVSTVREIYEIENALEELDLFRTQNAELVKACEPLLKRMEHHLNASIGGSKSLDELRNEVENLQTALRSAGQTKGGGDE